MLLCRLQFTSFISSKMLTSYFPTNGYCSCFRFSQFFISPLFTESATEREMKAVNSEHEKNIPK